MRLNVVDCSLVTDLLQHIVAKNDLPSYCFVVINGDNSTMYRQESWKEVHNSSGITLIMYDSQASRRNLRLSGNDCFYNLLIFDGVDSTLQFLNR